MKYEYDVTMIVVDTGEQKHFKTECETEAQAIEKFKAMCVNIKGNKKFMASKGKQVN